jgi:hypothetical protein
MMLDLWCYWKFEFVWRWDRLRETLVMFVAWRLLPYSVRYWVVVRAFADASEANPTVRRERLSYDIVVRDMG